MRRRVGAIEKTIITLLDNGSRLQGPAVARYVDRVRRAHPDESPAQIIGRLEKMFLTGVTGSGSAVGATAAFPGVGTLAAVGAVGAETVFFLEASALLTLAVASVHGIHPHDHEQRRALVLAVALGEAGMEVVSKAAGTTTKNWSAAVTGRIPGSKLKVLNNSLVEKFIRKYFAKRSALIVGKLVPAGIGAVIGGAGNRALGKRTISNARAAFGPPPAQWPDAPAALTTGAARALPDAAVTGGS